MVLTSSYRRRTAGFTAVFAAVLLILTAMFAISPAVASEVTPSSPCDQHGYEKFNSASGSESLEWGSMTWGQPGSLNVLSYDIDEGYSVEFCIKAGNVDNTFSGPRTGVGTVTHENPDISHVGYRVVGTPTEVTPDEPGFTDPDCDTAAAVQLPETEGVDYSIEGDVAPGETVTVTATPQAGYFFPEDATTEWEHTFADAPEDCEEPIEVATDEPTFTDPTCDVNEVGLTLPDTTGVVYTVTGDQEPGGTVTVTAEAAEGYELAEDADDEWTHTFGALATDCDEPETPTTDVEPDEVVKTPAPDVVEVSPDVVEKPAPDPAPAAQPAAQAAAQELPATGLGSTELLLLALLMLGLGAAALLGSDPRRQN